MTQDDHVRLRAVQQSERHAGVRRMKHRPSPFDHVPMIGGGIGAQHLPPRRPRSRSRPRRSEFPRQKSECRSGPWRESRHRCLATETAAARTARCTSCRARSRCQRSASRLPERFRPVATGIPAGGTRMSINALPRRSGGLASSRANSRQSHVRAAHDIQPRFECTHQVVDPSLIDGAPDARPPR